MHDYAVLIAMLAAVLLLAAWREYASDNRRDARLLGALGTGGILAGPWSGWDEGLLSARSRQVAPVAFRRRANCQVPTRSVPPA